jgi:maltooligosyltrehalose trehalohydrolase
VTSSIPLGATYLSDGHTQFNVWAPYANAVAVHVLDSEERIIPLHRQDSGYYQAVVKQTRPTMLYRYRLDGDKDRPDPASRSQPQGVHGPSQVVDQRFDWGDAGWFGTPLRDYIIYELHVGTFTPEGTFAAVIPYLDYLLELGITALELMPVAQFPGSRNWGYDGVYPFAVQHSYGGVDGLKMLVEACHEKRIAVILDVVYNHIGPEGNYLADFGPYFTERYRTPWGAALNFDGAHSDHVKRFFIDNALYWLSEFHIDALRLDAVHAILDHTAQPFIEALAVAVEAQATRLNRRAYLIAESSDNNARLITSRALGGYGIDAQWSDDFHHCVHTLLTGEQSGYYQDYCGVRQLAKAFREGFVYSGQHSVYRQRRHGSSSRHLPAQRFVVCSQNHDQVGNRMLGERLSQLVSFEQLKLAAGLTLLSPYIPLLFMGEEYGEEAPFQYFISHTDADLVRAVRQGRQEEFAAFGWQAEVPDPQDEASFRRCKLNHKLRKETPHNALQAFYQHLIRLRKAIPARARLDKDALEVQAYEKTNVLYVRRWSIDYHAALVFNLQDAPVSIAVNLPTGCWRKRLDSAEQSWQGPGSDVPEAVMSCGDASLILAPYSFVLLNSEEVSG